MLHIQMDPHCGIPVYRQIMDQIRYHVAAGRLGTGDRLPSVRELAKYLHINPTTIVKAYTELQHAGDIEMLHGKGAFVAEAGVPASRAVVDREFRERVRPIAVVASQMGLTAEKAARILASEMRYLSGEEAALKKTSKKQRASKAKEKETVATKKEKTQ